MTERRARQHGWVNAHDAEPLEGRLLDLKRQWHQGEEPFVSHEHSYEVFRMYRSVVAGIDSATLFWCYSDQPDQPLPEYEAPPTLAQQLAEAQGKIVESVFELLGVDSLAQVQRYTFTEVHPGDEEEPTVAQRRKNQPLFRGALAYFPKALLAVAELSRVANEQHNPGEPMHWAKDKSTDHADCIARHLLDSGTLDDDGQRHSAKVAWRALALLETELEAAAASGV